MLSPTPLPLAGFLLPRTCAACGRILAFQGNRPYAVCMECLALLREFIPPRCARCGRPRISEEALCMTCRRGSPSFDEALPLFDYHGIAGTLISAYKFGNHPRLARLFADLFEPHLRLRWPCHTLVPVPPRREALRLRGWDQVELVAGHLSRRGFPIARVLERTVSLAQKTLGLEARKDNARKAYRMRERLAAPRLVVLLDDVFTSGATASACAEALKAAGSERVAFLAIAAD